MNTPELKNILERQKAKLEEYLNIVNEKQNVLITNEMLRLQVITSGEQKILLEIKDIEDEWISVLKKNYSYDDQVKVEIKALQSGIKELVLEINRINTINKYLISNAREFIKEIMAAIFMNKKRSLIDRKI